MGGHTYDCGNVTLSLGLGIDTLHVYGSGMEMVHVCMGMAMVLDTLYLICAN